MSFPDHISETEQRIINVVLSNIDNLAHQHPDMTVEVMDEYDVAYRGTPDTAAMRKEIGHTGVTRVAVFPNGINSPAVRASVLFIHGNEEDVVSDSFWSSGSEWLEKHLCKGTPADLGDDE